MFAEVQVDNVSAAKASFREQEKEKGGWGGLQKTARTLRRSSGRLTRCPDFSGTENNSTVPISNDAHGPPADTLP